MKFWIYTAIIVGLAIYNPVWAAWLIGTYVVLFLLGLVVVSVGAVAIFLLTNPIVWLLALSGFLMYVFA